MATRVEPLHAGDELPAASDAVAEVEHFDGSLTRLDADAVAQLGRLADPDGRPHVVVTLGPGDSWHRTSVESARHGQYEAHTDSAIAMARDATFVARGREDGSAWFAALRGTVVVRGQAGGTVVLHVGEAVGAGPSGALGEVERHGYGRLVHDDEWIALNHVLDAEPEPEPAVDSAIEPAPEPEPEPIPVPSTSPTETVADVLERTGEDRDHPWRVGVASVLAIGLGIFSVVIGRSAGTPHDDADPDEAAGIAVPGPPAFSSPALTAPTTAPAPPAVDDKLPAPQLPEADLASPSAATAAATPPQYDVDGRTCSRRGDAVHYHGTIRNDDPVARDFTVQVRFVDRAGNPVAEAGTTVANVPPGGSRSFQVTGTGAALRAATDCEVGTVAVLG